MGSFLRLTQVYGKSDQNQVASMTSKVKKVKLADPSQGEPKGSFF